MQEKERQQSATAYSRLFETTERVINLDSIPTHLHDAKEYFERYYNEYPVEIAGGRFVQVKNDGIYTCMYEIAEKVTEVNDVNGNRYLEFFLA